MGSGRKGRFDFFTHVGKSGCKFDGVERIKFPKFLKEERRALATCCKEISFLCGRENEQQSEMENEIGACFCIL